MQDAPRLKTCAICFRAKIRCIRTQQSGPCDRCLRLDKDCYFAPARKRTLHRRAGPAGPLSVQSEQAPQSISKSPSRTEIPPSGLAEPHPGHVNTTHPHIGHPISSSGYACPIASGLVSEADAEAVLDVYRHRMAPHFPFVMIPSSETANTMRMGRPCLLLAVLTVASYNDPVRQTRLCRLLNDMVAMRMVQGKLVSLDALQGLLVSLAWAQYQPPPRPYSQHLHLATSIVSDLRLDRPKDPKLWNVNKLPQSQSAESQNTWSLEAQRALIGTYYLASSSSTILQKMHHFPYSPFIHECSLRVRAAGEYATDIYLPHIVYLQKLFGDLGDTLERSAQDCSIDEINARLAKLQADLFAFKSTLSFPLSECSTVALQLFSQELIVSQVLLPGFPFGSETFQRRISDSQQLLNCLAEAMGASKSLFGFLLNMTPGEEFVITNLAWVMLSCGLSLAVRLDVLARGPRLAPLTKLLLRLLDIQHTLRQITLRLEAAAEAESAASPSSPTTSRPPQQQPDRGTFKQFLRRVQHIQKWYETQIDELDSADGGGEDFVSNGDGCRVGLIDSESVGYNGSAELASTLTSVSGIYPVGQEAICDLLHFDDFSVWDWPGDGSMGA